MFAAAVVYLAVVALLPDVASTAAVVAFIALASPLIRDPEAPPTPRGDQLMLVAMIFLAAAVASSIVNQITLTGLWALGKFALIPLTIAALRMTRRYDLGPAIWLGSTVGAAATGLVALTQVALTDVWRPAAFTNPILFGDMALTLGFVSVASRWLVPERMVRARTMVSVAAVSLAVIASVLSQARGSWIAAPFLLLILALQHGNRMSQPRSIAIFGLVLAVTITFAAVSNGGSPIRYFERGVEDTAAYIVGPRDFSARSTGIGARFEMWRSAFGGFRSEPMLGIGWGNLRSQFTADVEAGVRVPRIAQYNHAHNQYIGSLANGGVVGLLALLGLLIVPAVFFAQALFDRDLQTSALGAAGLVVIVGFAIFGLTEAVFEKASPLIFYASTIGLLAAQLDRMDLRMPLGTPSRTGLVRTPRIVP